MTGQPEWSRFQLPTRVTQARSPGRGSTGSESDQVAAAPPGQSHWHSGISLAGPGRRGVAAGPAAAWPGPVGHAALVGSLSASAGPAGGQYRQAVTVIMLVTTAIEPPRAEPGGPAASVTVTARDPGQLLVCRNSKLS